MSVDSSDVDTGLGAIVLLARFHGVAAEPGQLVHQFGVAGEPFAIETLLRAAKYLQLKARHVTRDSLDGIPLPAIAASCDGSFLIVGKVSEDAVLVQERVKATQRHLRHVHYTPIDDVVHELNVHAVGGVTSAEY